MVAECTLNFSKIIEQLKIKILTDLVEFVEVRPEQVDIK